MEFLMQTTRKGDNRTLSVFMLGTLRSASRSFKRLNFALYESANLFLVSGNSCIPVLHYSEDLLSNDLFWAIWDMEKENVIFEKNEDDKIKQTGEFFA